MKSGHMVAIAVTLLCATAVAQQGPRRDGNWEVTMTMEMPGMPTAMPPFTMKQCVTKEQAENPEMLMPQQPGRGAKPDDCKVSDYKTSGNKVTWSMTCTGATPMTGTGEFVYAENTYQGTMKMNMDQGGKPMAMTMKYAGKRLGDCVK